MNNEIEFLKRKVAAQDETIEEWKKMYYKVRERYFSQSAQFHYSLFCNLILIIALVCAI